MAATGFMLWTLGDATIRYLQDYPSVVVAQISSLWALAIMLLFSGKLGGFRETFFRPKLGLRVLRGFMLSVSGFLSYVTFANLNLATAYAIIFCAPMLAKFISVVLTGESIRLRSWLVTILGFIGVLVVLRPGLIPLNVGTAAALGLAFFFALGHILARYIGESNQTLLSLVLFQRLFLIVGTALPAYSQFNGISIGAFTLLAAIGVVAVVGTILVSHAFMMAPSAYIAPIHYTQIIWGTCWGALLFHEFPDAWTIGGGSLIVLAGLLLIKFSRTRPALVKGT